MMSHADHSISGQQTFVSPAETPESPDLTRLDQTTTQNYWEVLGETRSWGRYLAATEKAFILRGSEIAGHKGNCVDLGCGGGRWSKVLADCGWSLTCVEVNQEALQACQLKIPSAKCVLVSPTETAIPCAAKSQRLMLCMEAPDVIEADWFIAEASRVIENAGFLIGFYMNPRSWRGAVWRMKRTTNGLGGRHYWGLPYTTWKRRFLRSGFEMLHEESYSWAPFGRESDSRLVPVLTKLERLLGLHRILSVAPWILFIAKKTGS